MSYPLVPSPGPRAGSRLSLEQFAAATGLHPQLVRRYVALGLLDTLGAGGYPDGEGAAVLEFAPAQVAVAARIVRLRAGLSLNYAALGVVLDLLSRIEQLEAALRRRPPDRGSDAPWT